MPLLLQFAGSLMQILQDLHDPPVHRVISKFMEATEIPGIH